MIVFEYRKVHGTGRGRAYRAAPAGRGPALCGIDAVWTGSL